MAGCGAATVLSAGYALTRRRAGLPAAACGGQDGKDAWRMPPLTLLHRPAMSAGRKAGIGALRLYLLVAMTLVAVRIVQLALGH
jgi:hypothetical protein